MSDRKKSKLWLLVRDAAVTLGVRDIINDSLLWCGTLGFLCKFLVNAVTLDRKRASRQITAVVFTVEPSNMLDACLRSLEAQTVRPGKIEVIRNISPFSKASQEGLNKVKTPYYVSVDDDMILDRHCFEHLYALINKEPNCAEVIAKLRDPILGSILGVRMYRTEAVRPIGFYPCEDEKGCERNMRNKLIERGHKRITCGIVKGSHHPVYEPLEAFWKFRFAGEKTRYYPKSRPTFSECAEQILDFWKRTEDDAALYALAGLFYGLESEDASQELTYDGRGSNEGFQRVQSFLESSPSGQLRDLVTSIVEGTAEFSSIKSFDHFIGENV